MFRGDWMLFLLMIEGMVGVKWDNTCFPLVQVVKKKKAGISPAQYRMTRSYEMARNKECLIMK